MRLHPAPLALLAILTLAACGEDAGPITSERLDAVIEATKDAKTFEVDIQLESKAPGDELELEGVGRTDVLATALDAELDIAAADEAIEVDVIDVASEVYLRSASYALPPGKRWLQTDDDEFANSFMTPAHFLALLRMRPELHDEGTDEIRGRETTHLRGKLDMELVATRPATGPLYTKLGREGASDVSAADGTLDVWLDDRDRLVRAEVALADPGRKPVVHFRNDIRAFGVPVDDIRPPAKAEVVEDDLVGE